MMMPNDDYYRFCNTIDFLLMQQCQREILHLKTYCYQYFQVKTDVNILSRVWNLEPLIWSPKLKPLKHEKALGSRTACNKSICEIEFINCFQHVNQVKPSIIILEFWQIKAHWLLLYRKNENKFKTWFICFEVKKPKFRLGTRAIAFSLLFQTAKCNAICKLYLWWKYIQRVTKA